MNLAPVVDVSDPEKDSFIGTRTFGKDPHNVSVMGASFANGLRDAGIIPTAKTLSGSWWYRGRFAFSNSRERVFARAAFTIGSFAVAQMAHEQALRQLWWHTLRFEIDRTGCPRRFKNNRDRSFA